MSHSLKKKIKILRSIFREYTKHSKFDIITCYIKEESIIIEQEFNRTDYNDLVTVAPLSEIDIIIVRNRSILHQARRNFKNKN